MNDETEKRKRGRPPLTEEQRAQRKEKQLEYYREYSKTEAGRASQHARQKEYHNKPEVKQKCRERYYNPSVYISPDFKQTVVELSKQRGVSVSELFILAFEEKYSVIIHKDDTTNN